MLPRLVGRLSTIVAFASAAVTAGAQTGTVAGNVTKASTGQPLAGVTVRSISGGTSVDSTTTDADGTYTLTRVRAGTWTIAVRKPGYAPKSAESVVVAAGVTAVANFAMSGAAVSLDPVVTTASRGATYDKILAAPVSIAVVGSEAMTAKPVTMITDYLKTVPGVSVSTAGIAQANTVSRGFNNAFSTTMLGLQDYRFNALPALRANLPFLYSGASEDIDRIEVLNGPAAALYGPNAANGVMHIITKSPFNSQGASLTLDGGGRSIFRGAGRAAGVLDDRKEWGVKASGEYFTGTDWPDRDPNLPNVFPNTAPPGRAGQPLARGTEARRYAGEASLDYRGADNGIENIVTAGYTKVLNSQEITGAFGPTQAKNWSYTTLQDRFRYKGFFAQVFYNGSSSGNNGPNDLSGSYYLTTGIPIVDNSYSTVYQAQQAFDLLKAKWVVGLDYIATQPKSKGTIYGRFDTLATFGGTSVTEKGAYVQGTMPLAAKVDLVTAFRGDQSNRLAGSQFSPHVAFVYKPDSTNSFRATFGRAFNSPIAFEYLLDQVANPYQAPGFALRAIGNPSKTGWQFNRACDATINGGLCMHSPWVASGGGAAVASSAASAFPGFVAALPGIINALPSLTATQKAQLTGLLAQLNPILSSLRPTPAQIGTSLYLNGPVAAAAVQDIGPLQTSFNNTWELGYKGILGHRLHVALDLWYQDRGDVGGAQVAQANPLVLYEPNSLGGYLVANITQGLVAAGLPQAQAQGTAVAAAGALVPLMAALPQGTLAFTSALNNDQSIIATYFNGTGHVDVRGVDLALDFQASDDWVLSATYSGQDKIVFPSIGGAANPLMSNTPKNRASATARYNSGTSGFGVETTVRYADAFPVNSGYYNTLTPNVFNTAFKSLAPVPAQTQVDLGLSYRFRAPRFTWGLTVSNLFDDAVPTFAGTPAIGRLLLTRIRYDF